MIFLKSLTTIKVNHSESHIKQKQVLSSSVSLFWLRQNRNCLPTCDYSRLPSTVQVPFCLKVLEQMLHSSDWVWRLLVILLPTAAFNLYRKIMDKAQPPLNSLVSLLRYLQEPITWYILDNWSLLFIVFVSGIWEMFSHNSAENVQILYKQLQRVENQGNLSI